MCLAQTSVIISAKYILRIENRFMDKQNLNIGDLVAFQIGEHAGFSAPNKDAWGVFKVLDTGNSRDPSFSLSLLDGLWHDLPRQEDVVGRETLIVKRFLVFSKQRTPWPVIFTMVRGSTIDDLLSTQVIGNDAARNPDETEAIEYIAAKGHARTLAALETIAYHADHEHRAVHDQDTWILEVEEKSKRAAQRRKEQQEREKNRLNGLTLEMLAAELSFEQWDTRHHILPKKFIATLRKLSKTAINSARALGPKPKRKDMRAVLKTYVLGINDVNGAHGYFIETEEREDIYRFIEELCWATKQKPLLDEIDIWSNGW